MVNLEKWEEVRFEDLKKGDTVKRITLNSDDTKVTVEGVIIYKSQYLGTWNTRDNFRLVDKNHRPNSTRIYRRKVAPFRFPASYGAMISAKWTHGRVVKFIRTVEGTWISLSTGMAYTVEELRAKAEDFAVDRQGASL